MFHFLASLLLIASIVCADLTCDRYVPIFKNSNVGAINFYGINKYSNVPSSNLTVGNPAVLDYVSPVGYRFHFQACNSTSLNLTAQLRVNGDCSQQCTQQHNTFIRVLNPQSGNCLTARNLTSTGTGELFFKTCNPNPVDRSQFWQVEQDISVLVKKGRIIRASAPLYFMTLYSNPQGYQYEPGDYSPWIPGQKSGSLLYHSPDSVDSLSSYIIIP